MISSMDVVTDVARLYDVAVADNALIEIELDTQQLRALTKEEEARLLLSEDLVAGHPDTLARNPDLNDSLEALLRLSWPVWKAIS